MPWESRKNELLNNDFGFRSDLKFRQFRRDETSRNSKWKSIFVSPHHPKRYPLFLYRAWSMSQWQRDAVCSHIKGLSAFCPSGSPSILARVEFVCLSAFFRTKIIVAPPKSFVYPWLEFKYTRNVCLSEEKEMQMQHHSFLLLYSILGSGKFSTLGFRWTYTF